MTVYFAMFLALVCACMAVLVEEFISYLSLIRILQQMLGLH